MEKHLSLAITEGVIIPAFGQVLHEGENVVAIEIDMRTKRGEVSFFGVDHRGVPSIHLDEVEGSIHIDPSRKGLLTEIAFLDFVGWSVFCANYSRYTVCVCLCRN